MSSAAVRRGRSLAAPGVTTVVPAAVAAAVTTVVYCLATALCDRRPFGSRSLLTNDLGAQFVPMHAELRDLLTGHAPGDLLFSWTSGAGVPFLPDFATYLASPFAPLVLLFPRDRVDLAVYVITTLKLALAAAAMTTFLRMLRPDAPAWAGIAGGIAYGTCGWALDDASYVTMWLDGLVGLPLLAIAAHWSRQGRRFVVGTLLVALVWWANYYTGYMASVGVALMLVALVVGEGTGVRAGASAVARFAAQGVLGVTLTAVTLLPTVLAVGEAQPAQAGSFHRYPWAVFAARLLPGSEGVGHTPSITVGSVVLLLAATLPWRSAVPIRLRTAWCVGLAAVVVSMQVPFTQSAWHGFDIPNGSPFRQAFVVCAWLVVAAFLAVADGAPRLRELAGGALLVVGVAVLARTTLVGRRQALLDPASVTVLAVVVAATVVLLVLARRRRRLLPLAGAMLVAVTAVEATWTATVVDEQRAVRISAYPAWEGYVDDAIAVGRAAREQWPATRLATPGTWSPNEPAVVGAPGVDYYSSTIPARTSQMFVGLGASWRGYGRVVHVPSDDAALGAILSVGTVQVPGRGLTTRPALPLVRMTPTSTAAEASSSDPLAARARLLGPQVYRLPAVTGPRRAEGTVTLRASCPAGTRAQAFLGGVRGELLPGRRLDGGQRVLDLGPADGPVTITVRADAPAELPAHTVGCLDPAALERSVAAARADAPTVRAAGHGIDAEWGTPRTGRAVVATSAAPAWACTVDGRDASTSAVEGLLAVDLAEGRRLSCRYETPGLRAGGGLSGLSALTLVCLALLGRRRQSRGPSAAARA